MVVTNNAIDNTVGNTNSGITNTFTVQNLSNTASSQAQINTSVAGTSAGDCWNQFTVGAARSWALGQDNSDSQTLKINTTNGATITPSSGTNVWNMSTAGTRRMPLQPFFNANNPIFRFNVTGDGTSYLVEFTTVVFDQASNYNNGTFLFTAPLTTAYFISGDIFVNNISAAHTTATLWGRINGVDAVRFYNLNLANVADASGSFALVFATFVSLNAGDTLGLALQVSGGTKTINVGGSFFTGALLY